MHKLANEDKARRIGYYGNETKLNIMTFIYQFCKMNNFRKTVNDC